MIRSLLVIMILLIPCANAEERWIFADPQYSVDKDSIVDEGFGSIRFWLKIQNQKPQQYSISCKGRTLYKVLQDGTGLQFDSSIAPETPMEKVHSVVCNLPPR